jgi:hypothetical protein
MCQVQGLGAPRWPQWSGQSRGEAVEENDLEKLGKLCVSSSGLLLWSAGQTRAPLLVEFPSGSLSPYLLLSLPLHLEPNPTADRKTVKSQAVSGPLSCSAVCGSPVNLG